MDSNEKNIRPESELSESELEKVSGGIDSTARRKAEPSAGFLRGLSDGLPAA